MPNKATTHEVDTSWGTIRVKVVEEKVIGCALPRVDNVMDKPFSIIQCPPHSIARFVIAMLEGRTRRIPVYERPAGTDFQREVWSAIASIQHGDTASYSELAQAIDHPRAYRAVANACGANPMPLFIPCHRVVGANGTLGGFSAGLAWKRLLLSAEGCPLN